MSSRMPIPHAHLVFALSRGGRQSFKHKLRASRKARAGACTLCSALHAAQVQEAGHSTQVMPLSACRPGEEAAKAFVELAAVLGQAPDPQPYLDAIGPLQERVTELHRESRRLQAHRQAAESEASSTSQAVLRSRELERENADLQAQLKQKVQHIQRAVQFVLWARCHNFVCLPWTSKVWVQHYRLIPVITVHLSTITESDRMGALWTHSLNHVQLWKWVCSVRE